MESMFTAQCSNITMFSWASSFLQNRLNERRPNGRPATRATYACGLDAFARCFDVQSVDLLIAKIKSSELDAYNTLDKFVSWLAGNGAAPKTIWIYTGAVKSLLEHEDVLLDKRKLRKVQMPAKVEIMLISSIFR